LKTWSGKDIIIEERDPAEVSMIWGLGEDGNTSWIKLTAEGTKVRNPAFDVTPARYLTGFITECGLIEKPFQKSINLLYG
jgi:methylthioribose-1-phosphate isomerase